MKWLDYVIVVVNIALTIYTMYNAKKSNECYQKSKYLTDYTNNNLIFIESKKILDSMTSILQIQKKFINKEKGINCDKELSNEALSISKSIKEIKAIASSNELSDIETILKPENFDVEIYIDSIISGIIVFKEGENIANEDYNQSKRCFEKIQKRIKCEIDEKAKKLK